MTSLPRDVDVWTHFIFTTPNAMEWIQNNQPLCDLVWYAKQLYIGTDAIRKELGAQIPTVKLMGMFVEQFPDKTNLLKLNQDDSEDKMRQILIRDLSLDSLCDAFGENRKLGHVDTTLWTWILDSLSDPGRILPSDMSEDMQRQVISRRCKLEALFLQDGARRKQLQDIMEKHFAEQGLKEHFYLNLKKPSLCELVAGLNQILKTDTQRKIEQCNALFLSMSPEQKAQHQDVGLKIDVWNRIQQDWKHIYQCSSIPCETYLERLRSVAAEVQDFSNQCAESLLSN